MNLEPSMCKGDALPLSFKFPEQQEKHTLLHQAESLLWLCVSTDH